MDPHNQEEEQQIADIMDVQQSVLLEVWDSDMALTKDFLGEAWLPPLATFGPRTKDIVLALTKADFSDDAERGPSREVQGKDLGDDKGDPNKKITGELFVSVSWTFPAENDKGLEQEIDDWFRQTLSFEDRASKTQGKTTVMVLKERYNTVKEMADDFVKANGDVKSDLFSFMTGLDKKEQDKVKKWFKAHTNKEDLKNRADEEQKKHTGRLKIVVKKARNLRRADAKKFRDCDPQVTAWIRNDVAQQFRKRPMLRSKTITNNRDPEWTGSNACEQEIMLMTGSYEARVGLPEEGWAAEFAKAFRSRKQTRIIDESRQVNAVKRFGQTGMRIKFFESDRGAQSRGPQAPGENHRVEIYQGDSIHEFKSKLTKACAEEATYWKALKGEMSEEAQQYSNIQIGFKHLVMVFVPSAKVKKLYQKGIQDDEYKRAYEQAWLDPSSWQPLEQSRSFSHYPQHAFGRGRQGIPLRVVEATEQYKAQNIRYKQMDQEMSIKGYQDTNDTKRCFGWAKYTHKRDGDSSEWRPAFLGKNKGGPEDKPWQVKWVFETGKPKEASSASPTTGIGGFAGGFEVDKASVLLAPRTPAITDMEDPRHKELLEQASTLRSSGKSDWEIEALLKKLLDDRWEQDKQEKALDESQRPPPISVDIIRTYLQRKDAQATNTTQ